MTTIDLPNNWLPREYQMPLWRHLEHGGLRAYVIAHRRWGKDDVCLHRSACAAMERVGNYWHMLPEASQARKAIWDAVNPHTGKRRIDEAFPREIRETTKDNEMFIRFKNGSTWQVLGSDNYDSFVGSPPVGVVFSEWALADPQVWGYIKPILDENNGWALFITTPRGRNHAYKFFQMAQESPDWFAEFSPATKTNVFTPDKLEAAKKELIMLNGDDDGEAKFNQEYLCDFNAQIVGAYYGKEIRKAEADNRICGVPYNPALEVHTSWDLGFGDATAIWFFQISGKEIHIIDYHEQNGVGLDVYVKMLKERQYNYGTHVLPHDAGQGSLRTGKTLRTQLEEMGLRNLVVLPRDDIDPGIQLVRQLLPRCWFDHAKCKRGIEALTEYQKKWNDERKVFSNTPLHNWASNGADSFRYLAVWLATQYGAGYVMPDKDPFKAAARGSWMSV